MPRKQQVGRALLKWLQDTDNFVDVVSWFSTPTLAALSLKLHHAHCFIGGIRSRVYTLQPYNVMTNNAVETAEGDGGVDMEDMGFKM